MRRTLAVAALLGIVLTASPAAALACLNSKPCNGRCIPYKQICIPGRCGTGYYLCHGRCISKRILCLV
jgi:hypothetical protein